MTGGDGALGPGRYGRSWAAPAGAWHRRVVRWGRVTPAGVWTARRSASWDVRPRARAWIEAHNRKARPDGGVRLVARVLPVESPWLDPGEPEGARGKKGIVEPERLLAAHEVRTRVCDECRFLKS